MRLRHCLRSTVQPSALAGGVTSAVGPVINGHGFVFGLVANTALSRGAAVLGGQKFVKKRRCMAAKTMAMWRTNFSIRYAALAMLTLALGLAFNLLFGDFGARMEAIRRSSLSELYFILALYVGAHLIVLGIALGFSYFLEAKVRAISFAIASTALFVLSLIFFTPRFAQGLHFVVIFFLGLVVITLDNLRNAHREKN
jgi:hypothetical protein